MNWDLTPSRGYFVLAAGATAGHAPSTNTAYNFGANPNLVPGTGDSAYSVTMPRAGTVKRVYGVFVVAGTLAWTHTFTVSAKNNTGPVTHVVSTSVVGTAVANTFNASTLSLSFVAGDGIQVRFVTPQWTTLPTVTFWTVTAEVEYT